MTSKTRREMNRNVDFSPKHIALALQVGESSVKRWCDAGSIRSMRTVGGHRRIPLDAVLEFLQQSGLQLVHPELLGLSGAPTTKGQAPLRPRSEGATPPSVSLDEVLVKNCPVEQQREFFDALRRGEETICRRYVHRWRRKHGGVIPVCEQLILPALRAIGEAWQCLGLEVFQERRACGICERLLHELRIDLPQQGIRIDASSPRAIGCAPAGDPYTLPTAMVELALREAGWNACSHGNDVPLQSMLAAFDETHPAIVWVSVSTVGDETDFVKQFNRLSDHLSGQALLIVGGQAMHDSLRRQLHYSAYCDTLRQLVDLAKTLQTQLQ